MAPRKKVDVTPGGIATVNAETAIPLIASVETLEDLDAIQLAEEASEKHPGGRKGVLAAIAARRAELTPEPTAEPAPATEPPAEAPADLDAAPAPPVEDDDAPTPTAPEVNPLDLVEGEVPLYNPFYAPVEAPYNGESYTVRAGGVDFVPLLAAHIVVGPDNAGGKFSRMGLRRLYGPEPRFEEAAKAAGLDLTAWCEQRNARIKAEADEVCAAFIKAHPELNVAEDGVSG